MRRGREGLVSLASTIRVFPCESVLRGRLPGERLCALLTNLQMGCLYVFWGLLKSSQYRDLSALLD
jgi:hypothetical protein